MLPFTLTGIVIHGQSMGNTYDSPTANIIPEEDVSSLSHGVYYSVVEIDGQSHPAITNLGVRPTVNEDGRVNAETYIYSYDEDLYGRAIKVTLLVFARPEKKFDSVDELFETVRSDLQKGAVYHGLPDV